MTIFLRKLKAHAVIEGRDPGPWSNDDDYAVVEGKLIGRIYSERKWRWFLRSGPVVPRPNSGEATLWKRRTLRSLSGIDVSGRPLAGWTSGGLCGSDLRHHSRAVPLLPS
jgi:hypothetical protein